MKQSISFVDAKNVRFTVEYAFKRVGNNEDIYHSFCGKYGNGGGQCDGHIVPRTDSQKELVALWNQEHLKTPISDEQRDKVFKEVENLFTAIGKEELDRIENAGLDLFGYSDAVKDFRLDDEEAVENFLNNGIPADLPYMSKQLRITVLSLMEANDISFFDVIGGFDEDVVLNGEIGLEFSWYGQDLIVGMKEDLQDLLDGRRDDYDYKGFWQQAVAAGQTEDGFDKWFESVVEEDWRSELDRYAGQGTECLIDGEYYYVMQA